MAYQSIFIPVTSSHISKRRRGAIANNRVLAVTGLACTICLIVGWFLGRNHASRDNQIQTATHAISVAGTSKQLHTKCDNTCAKANNQICEDGRHMNNSSNRQAVECDLGTDCADCGPYIAPQHNTHGWSEEGPIAYLKNKLNVPLYAKMTVTSPPFMMMYTDPAQDLDVSAHMDNSGMIENGITEVFRLALQDKCIDPVTGNRKLVLDIGANFGYFSVYAAQLGCRVIAWEPVPHFRAFIHHVLAVNNVTDLVTVRDKVVSDVAGQTVTMQAPTRGIWGTASVAGIAQHAHQVPMQVDATTERIDDVVNEDVLLMKVDVEGFEPFVLQSATNLMTRHTVDNVLLEYNPGVAERAAYITPNLTHLVEATPRMLVDLLDKGYKIGMMYDHIAKGGHPYTPGSLPALKEVTRPNLEYDLQDAASFTAAAKAHQAGEPRPNVFNCPVIPELMEKNSQWGDCIRQPENAHPKSVRVTFSFNTNMWAARNHQAFKVDGTVGVFDLHDNAQLEYFVNREMTVGARSCQYLPANMLIINRCPCSWAEKRKLPGPEVEACRQEERVLKHQMLAVKRLKYRDFQHPG